MVLLFLFGELDICKMLIPLKRAVTREYSLLIVVLRIIEPILKNKNLFSCLRWLS